MAAAPSAAASIASERVWRRVPRRIWAVTRPLGSNVSRSLALCICGVVTFRAGRSVAHRFGIVAFVSTLVDQAMEAVEGVKWLSESLTLVVAVSSGLMEELRQFVIDNPLMTIMALLVIMDWWCGDPPSDGLRHRAVPPCRPGSGLPPPPAPHAPWPSRPVASARDDFVGRLLDDKHAFRRQVDELQDKLAARAQPSDLGGTGVAVERAADPGEGDLLQRLLTRLDRMEAIIRQDSGRPPDVAGDVNPHAAPVVRSSGSLAETVVRLERSTRPPHQVFLEQLKSYRDIPASQWPMPPGYTQRLAPHYLAEVYRDGTTVQSVRRWLRDHDLTKNVPAQEMLSIMEAVDDAVMSDGTDVINSLTFEKLVRRAMGSSARSRT